ncbi:MAG: adenosylhomocysteinase [Erythrobacter sp.]|nr:adenosylhomocysteinase [Erythrobacter sp.]
MTLIIANNERALSLYERILKESNIKKGDCAVLVVQHVLPNTIPLFKILRSYFEVVGVIPKRKSTNPSTLSQLENSDPPFPILNCTRRQLRNEEYLRNNVKMKIGDRKLIILDIGGYFSDSIELLGNIFQDKIIGIIEDTENGHQKYDRYVEPLKQKGGNLPFPVFSVARSPLKEPEDYLVGQSIVYSAENVLREHNTLLNNKVVLVLGYGKIGKSIANSLAVRNVTVWVYDKDPIKCAQALSHGFHVPTRDHGISGADLIFCATGNKSLEEVDFLKLKHQSFVCSVTSADDEFEFGELRKKYGHRDTNANSEIFDIDANHRFHLMNEGNAINFLHGAVLGTYIYLVACELLFCLVKIIDNGGKFKNDRITTLSTQERQTLAAKWMEEFRNGDS